MSTIISRIVEEASNGKQFIEVDVCDAKFYFKRVTDSAELLRLQRHALEFAKINFKSKPPAIRNYIPIEKEIAIPILSQAKLLSDCLIKVEVVINDEVVEEKITFNDFVQLSHGPSGGHFNYIFNALEIHSRPTSELESQVVDEIKGNSQKTVGTSEN